MILLDTHVLVWMDADEAALGPSSRLSIQRSWDAGRVAVSAISFWECAMLEKRGRLVLPDPIHRWRSELLAAGLVERPLDGEIAVLAAQLDTLHRDPADRFIVATAIMLGATLLTADERLLSWQHRLAREDARQ